MKATRFSKPFFILVLSLIFITFLFAKPASKAKAKTEVKTEAAAEIIPTINSEINSDVNSGENSESSESFSYEAVPLTMPKNYKSARAFSQIPQKTMDDVRMGTSSSLRQAFSELRKSDQSYDYDTVVLLNIINGINEILYPEEKIPWPVPPAPKDNNYILILESAKKGLYDFNSGNKNFLEKVLPSLVLVTSPNSKNFYDESLTALTSALKENSASFLANYLRALLSYRQEKFTEANVFFQKCYEISPDYMTMAKLYADSLSKSGEKQAAYDLAYKLLEKEPENFELLKICAYGGIKDGDLLKSEQFIIRALQQEPDNPEFIFLRAKMLMEKKEYINVSSLLDVYSRTDSTSKDYLLIRATLLKDWNKNYSSAAEYINQALDLYPHDKDVILLAVELMNESMQKIGNRSSKELLAEVLASDPNNDKAKELMLSIYVSEEDWKSAKELSTEMIQKQTYNEKILQMHIKCCIKLGTISEAKKTLTLLNKISSDRASYDLTNIQVLIADNSKNEALKQINSCLTKDYSNSVKSSLYYERSRIATSSESQLADLRSCLTSNPRNSDGLIALYRYYFDKKDYRKSQYYLRQAVALNPQNKELIKYSAQLEELLK